jgi:hypothetical protein
MTDALVVARRADTRPVSRLTPLAWILLTVVLTAALLAVKANVSYMLVRHLTPDYGCATIIPFIAAFLVWQRRDKIERASPTGSWAGLLLALIGTILGRMSALLEWYAEPVDAADRQLTAFAAAAATTLAPYIPD